MAMTPDFKKNGRNDMGDKAVALFLDVISKHYDTKVMRDSINLRIQQMFENGFNVFTLNGPQWVTPKMLNQAFWRCANRMKPLDFAIYGSGNSAEKNKVITDAIGTVMKRAGFQNSFGGKGGIAEKLLLYGDSFIQIGTDKKRCVDFSVVSNTNNYVDSYATNIRVSGGGRSATRFIIVYSYPIETVRRMFPDDKDEIGSGRIPRSYSTGKDQDRTYIQQQKIENDGMSEVAYCYDIEDMENPCHIVMVGSNCTIVDRKEGDNYPFMYLEEPIIPVSQFICMPASAGFYNHGIGEMIFSLAMLSSRLINLAYSHAEDVTYPMNLVNLPQRELATFFQKMDAAYKMRGAGRKGFVAMGYDEMNPNSTRASVEPFMAQSMFNEFKAMYDILTQELRRMGINLDESDFGPDKTASQVISEEENANAFIKQVMEYNAPETEMLVNFTIESIKKNVRTSNKTQLNIKTALTLPDGGEIPVKEITLGMIADELRNGNYWVEVNSRSGAIPSNAMELARISRQLQVTPPGSQAYYKLLARYSSLNGSDLTIDSFQPPQQAEPDQMGSSPGKPDPYAAMTSTDRRTINPNLHQEIPAF